MMDERFGRYIKTIRRNKGITLDEISRKLNMPAMLWLDIENGELKPPRLGKLLKLSESLHLSSPEHDHMLQLAGDEIEAWAGITPMNEALSARAPGLTPCA